MLLFSIVSGYGIHCIRLFVPFEMYDSRLLWILAKLLPLCVTLSLSLSFFLFLCRSFIFSDSNLCECFLLVLFQCRICSQKTGSNVYLLLLNHLVGNSNIIDVLHIVHCSQQYSQSPSFALIRWNRKTIKQNNSEKKEESIQTKKKQKEEEEE